jgi:integrase
MPRPPRPWFRAERNAWFAQVDGKQVRLAIGRTNRPEAEKTLRRLLTARDECKPISAGLTVRDVCNLFLAHSAKRRAAVTVAGYERHLVSACRSFGAERAESLPPHRVTTWLDGQTGWGDTTRFNAVTAVKAAFRWAKRSGYLAVNPIADLERPTPARREAVPTPEQLEAILDACGHERHRELLSALAWTGCRPGEVYGLTAADVDLAAGTWTVQNKVGWKTGERTRTVYLTTEVLELSRHLVERFPTGPIFRNVCGRPWTRNAVALLFRRIRRKTGLGREATAYALRHYYVTSALESGVPIATVAALVGHLDVTMISRVYSKLSQRREHLRSEAERVKRVG